MKSDTQAQEQVNALARKEGMTVLRWRIENEGLEGQVLVILFENGQKKRYPMELTPEAPPASAPILVRANMKKATPRKRPVTHQAASDAAKILAAHPHDKD
jgi:hypothetical protein